MSELSYNFYWNEQTSAAWTSYLRQYSTVEALNAGTRASAEAAAARMSACMTNNTRDIIGSIGSLESSISGSLHSLDRSVNEGFTAMGTSIDAMGRLIAGTFDWGFNAMLASLGGMQTTLEQLVKLAKTSPQTAAYEQFEIARDAFRQGLFPESLEALQYAIEGVAGVAAGYRLEWRFYQLRGLVLLGSCDNYDPQKIDPARAEEAFLLAARYARRDFPTDAAKALLSAGWSAYVQATPAKLQDALAHTEAAVALDPHLGEALFQTAKFHMALGNPAEALPQLAKAASFGGVFLAKAAADGDFKKHDRVLEAFLRELRETKALQVRKLAQPLADKLAPLMAEFPALATDPAARRVVTAAGDAPMSLIELTDYQVSGLEKDRKALEEQRLYRNQAIAKEWEETVCTHEPTGETRLVPSGRTEKVPTGETEEYEEEIILRPGSWFRKAVREKVTRRRPVMIEKPILVEQPVTREVRKILRRRGPETGWSVQQMDGTGRVYMKFELVKICPGSFQMGTASGGDKTERPVTRVTISRPFWMAKTEVTQRQWHAVMGNNPSYFKGDNLPVERVSWNEAMEYCRKLTERERAAGRLPEGYAYTLPTEAQWEYAARAGTTGDYGGTGRLDDMGWYTSNRGGSTKPVGTKGANAWGLHDMHGNVWEWCLDWYGTYPGGSVTDPMGAASGSYRVRRGGGWNEAAVDCRSAVRGRNAPDYRIGVLGFRPALSSVC